MPPRDQTTPRRDGGAARPKGAYRVEALAKGLRILGLFSVNPFPAGPPRFVRAQYYQYHFTTPDEHRTTGLWWTRRLIGEYYGPIHR